MQVLTTSNITEAIDLAFVDRADIKAYIGNPGLQARLCMCGLFLVAQLSRVPWPALSRPHLHHCISLPHSTRVKHCKVKQAPESRCLRHAAGSH